MVDTQTNLETQADVLSPEVEEARLQEMFEISKQLFIYGVQQGDVYQRRETSDFNEYWCFENYPFADKAFSVRFDPDDKTFSIQNETDGTFFEWEESDQEPGRFIPKIFPGGGTNCDPPDNAQYNLFTLLKEQLESQPIDYSQTLYETTKEAEQRESIISDAADRLFNWAESQDLTTWQGELAFVDIRVGEQDYRIERDSTDNFTAYRLENGKKQGLKPNDIDELSKLGKLASEAEIGAENSEPLKAIEKIIKANRGETVSASTSQEAVSDTQDAEVTLGDNSFSPTQNTDLAQQSELTSEQRAEESYKIALRMLAFKLDKGLASVNKDENGQLEISSKGEIHTIRLTTNPQTSDFTLKLEANDNDWNLTWAGNNAAIELQRPEQQKGELISEQRFQKFLDADQALTSKNFTSVPSVADVSTLAQHIDTRDQDLQTIYTIAVRMYQYAENQGLLKNEGTTWKFKGNEYTVSLKQEGNQKEFQLESNSGRWKQRWIGQDGKPLTWQQTPDAAEKRIISSDRLRKLKDIDRKLTSLLNQQTAQSTSPSKNQAASNSTNTPQPENQTASTFPTLVITTKENKTIRIDGVAPENTPQVGETLLLKRGEDGLYAYRQTSDKNEQQIGKVTFVEKQKLAEVQDHSVEVKNAKRDLQANRSTTASRSAQKQPPNLEITAKHGTKIGVTNVNWNIDWTKSIQQGATLHFERRDKNLYVVQQSAQGESVLVGQVASISQTKEDQSISRVNLNKVQRGDFSVNSVKSVAARPETKQLIKITTDRGREILLANFNYSNLPKKEERLYFDQRGEKPIVYRKTDKGNIKIGDVVLPPGQDLSQAPPHASVDVKKSELVNLAIHQISYPSSNNQQRQPAASQATSSSVPSQRASSSQNTNKNRAEADRVAAERIQQLPEYQTLQTFLEKADRTLTQLTQQNESIVGKFLSENPKVSAALERPTTFPTIIPKVEIEVLAPASVHSPIRPPASNVKKEVVQDSR